MPPATTEKAAPAATAVSTAAAAAAAAPRWRLTYGVDVQIHAFLLLIAAIVFSNGLRGDLAFDDHLAVERNLDSHADKTSFYSTLFNDFWGKRLDRFESNGSYRPITVLTFRIQHWLMGYHHSAPFLHFFNYAVAYVNVGLVFYLARLYVYVVVPSAALPTDASKLESFSAVLTSPLHAVPFVAALLYLVHPVHVDAVTSIVGRCELLYCLFGLIGFFCVHRYLNQVDERADAAATAAPAASSAGSSAAEKLKAKAAAAERGKQPAKSSGRIYTGRYVVFAAYALIISILCKDSAITFTAIYGVHACVMYACGRCQRSRTLIVIAVAVVELISYLAFRRAFIGNVDLQRSPLLRQTENPQYFVPKGLFHWLSMRWVIQVKNLELLFFPTSLCCEYSYNCIPHMFSLQDPRVPLFTAVTAATLAAAGGCLYGTFVSRSRLAMAGLLGFLWIAIPYAPVSHLFIAVGTFIAERCLYVPSIGAVLLLTFLVAAPGLRRGAVVPYLYVLLLLCVGWGVFSHRRNEDWWSDERLFRAARKTCPNSGKVHSQLASTASSRERRITPEIVSLAKRAIELDPTLRESYYYLAMNEVNSHQDIPKAYEYLRMCMEDGFAMSTCQDTYDKVRAMLFPHMTDMEQLLDYASLVTLKSQKATQLRQAAILALQKYQKPCLARGLLDEALDLWNASRLYWLSDEVHRSAAESTYCNAAYWYGQTTMLCDQQTMAGVVEAPLAKSKGARTAAQGADEDQDDEDEDEKAGSSKQAKSSAPPTPQEAAQRSASVTARFSLCETNWRHVLSEPKYNYPTIPHRMTQFLTVGDSTAGVVHFYMNYTAPHTPERNALLLSYLDIVVRQYCHLAALLHDPQVRSKITEMFPEQLAGLEHGFPGFRQSRLSEMRTIRRDLKMSDSMNATQKTALQRISERGACSDDLSFLIA